MHTGIGRVSRAPDSTLVKRSLDRCQHCINDDRHVGTMLEADQSMHNSPGSSSLEKSESLPGACA